MDLPDGLIPTSWVLGSHLLFAFLLAGLVRMAPWRNLAARPDLALVFAGFLAGVVFLWTARAGIPQNPGLNLHLLGATILTLAFGWPLALMGLIIVLLITTFLGNSGWETFSLNALLLAGIPVLVAAGVHQFVHRRLPNHPFVYIFVSAFLGGALTMAVLAAVSGAVLSLSGTYGMEALVREYLRYFPLLMFPEAFLTGGILAILVVYRPEWVVTFDDEAYLKGK
ncbi:MAG: energy-coupling factor ABC transporter permease [Thiohalorhabdus sp.]|uniref:energy-coupling factor ABC transporter permease n=1 Tax=Thiohalorhabdus sp. TaxID=3094134 RepID=UPI00397FFC95